MCAAKNINLSISLTSDDGTPLSIKSIQINGEVFKPESKELDSPPVQDEAAVIPVIASVDTIEENLPLKKETDVPLPRSEDYDTLENYGGKSIYKTFWGSLTYKPLDEGRSQVTYEGDEDVFDPELVGCWVEPSRIHKCPPSYPRSGRNYFPNALSVVYSRVIDFIDSKNLILDFAYNGGEKTQPKRISHQDGIFFFDNRFALEAWANSISRKNTLKAKAGQIYGVLGMPSINVKPDSVLNFEKEGEGKRPAIHCMWSDAFTGDAEGKGLDSPASFKETFGDNGTFFHLPGTGKVDINFDWQFIPATYSHKVVQFGSPNGSFFNDASLLSTQYGLKRVANYDQFRLKDEMKAALGFVREGVTFSMPNQGYCNGGGIHDGRDISEFCTYRFEGDWVSKNPNNMKARTSGGLRIEWVGFPDGRLGNFIEMESEKTSRFDNLNLRFISPNRVEVDSPYFTWHHLASQEFTGGTSTGSEMQTLIISGFSIGMNTNGDFWLINADDDTLGRGFSSNQINIFDKIPRRNDVLSQNLTDHKSNGLIGKIDNQTFEIWGWSIQKGDVFSFGGQNFTVTQTQRKWKTWQQYGTQFPTPEPRLNRSDRRITYTEIKIDKPITQSVGEVSFKIEQSKLEPLLDGVFRKGCSAIWGDGKEAPGHLLYTDYNVNLVMKNIQTHGLIRSTARPLYAETTAPLQGNISSIPVGNLGSKIWEKGCKLQLAHPETGIKQEVELITSFSGNSGNLLIKLIGLTQEFPTGSIVVGLFSLCSEASFENVYFVNEDGSPSYSERIDYRPQGLRLRQLLLSDDRYRVKIHSGRISWYSNLDNRFEPELEFTGHPHLVNPKSVVPVILNPVFADRKGAKFGFQLKEEGKEEIFITSRVVAKDGKEIHLDSSELGSDLTLEGNGTFIIDNLKSGQFVTRGKKENYGFNLRFQDRFLKSTSLNIQGKNGKAGLIIDSPYAIGDFTLKLVNWELFPGIFNGGGFQTKQDRQHPEYGSFVSIQVG